MTFVLFDLNSVIIIKIGFTKLNVAVYINRLLIRNSILICASIHKTESV